MTDVFISYSREDRDRAQTVARALEKQGFTVWWDRKIPPGKTFDEVIHEALQGTSCVIVLWSKTSVRSDWVKEEAQIGAEREVLVPALIDAVPIPLGFGRIQTANLVGWRGDLAHPEFEQLSRSVAEMGELQFDTQSMTIRPREAPGQPPSAEAPPLQRRASDAEARSRPRRRLPAVAATLGLLVAAAAGSGYFLYANDMVSWPPGGDRQEPPDEQPFKEEPPVAPPIPGPSGPAAEPEPGIATADPPRESPAGPPLPTPEEDKAAEEAQRRRDEAIARLEKLEVLEAEFESKTSDAELLELYQEVSPDPDTDLDPEPAEALKQRIAALEESTGAFAELEQQAGSEDLTVRERLALWKGYQPARLGSPEARQAASEVVKLTGLMEGSATIAEDDKMVIARDIRRDGEGKPVGPRGVTNELPPGNVYLFAWVRSPGSERLEIQWRDGSGEVLQSQSTRVGRNLATGYRLAYYKHFSEPGEYEVRLYSQGGQLIGRRAFRIKS